MSQQSTQETSSSGPYELPADWRGETMSQIRILIKQANPEVVEDVKWKTPSNPGGVLVWYHEGMICTGEIYKKHLRLTFAKGPALKAHDPTGLINAYRAILLYENDKIDEKAFKDLIQAAVKLNKKNESGAK